MSTIELIKKRIEIKKQLIKITQQEIKNLEHLIKLESACIVMGWPHLERTAGYDMEIYTHGEDI